MKRVAAALALLLLCAQLIGCARKNPYEGVPNPIATIEMENGDAMRIELFVSEAPNTVANFVSLANAGFYDGMWFHRIAPGGFIQSGDPAGDGTGGPGYAIEGEFSQNGVPNGLSHTRGILSMARQSGYDTAGSQFFILQGSYPEYDGVYAAFGRLMDDESLQTLDAIANVAVDAHQVPVKRAYIATIRVETMGYKYSPSIIQED